MSAAVRIEPLDTPEALVAIVAARVAEGARLAALFVAGSSRRPMLTAAVAARAELALLTAPLEAAAYPALSPLVPAAAYYERAIHDLHGIAASGVVLNPLILPLPEGAERPRPGSGSSPAPVEPDEHTLPVHVTGEGTFTLPYGPVRSGVFETIEYLVENAGEEILHLWVRPFYKHRGVAKAFEHRTIDDGVLLAERVEGVASVAHAVAYCHAVETAAGIEVPQQGAWLRVLYAELERAANHLDVIVRLCEAAGLAVANARFAWHKERVLRLLAALTGSRFGRATVVPGGVAGAPQLAPSDAARRIGELAAAVSADVIELMRTESFLDRLWGTGVVTPEEARAHGALGPVGRGSAVAEDVRRTRAYGAYAWGAAPEPRLHHDGDAHARLRVRVGELEDALALASQAVDEARAGRGGVRVEVPEGVSGRACGWAEAPHGEVLYFIGLEDGRIHDCYPRSASFHNLPLLPAAFKGDVLTDFAFIEASFGLSPAGVVV